MKYLSYLIIGSLLAGCAMQPRDSFLLQGSICGADGEPIYLAYQLNDTVIVTDTAIIADGAFSFSGSLPLPYARGTVYMGDAQDYRNPNRLGIILEPADMTVSIDTARFSSPVITGSQTQAEADSLETIVLSIREEAAELYAIISDHSRTEAEREEAQDKLDPFIERMKEATMEFIKTHPDSYVSPMNLQIWMSQLSFEELKELYDGLTDKVKQYGDVEEIETEIAALERTQPGMTAPDFATIDVNGDSIRFSEAVQGKVVLLDFWASWCKPCRASMPHVKELYKKYHDKGFEVFCVSDNDSSPDKWREAIKEDGLENFFHVLRGFRFISMSPYRVDRSKDISSLYAIHYLPTKYLIDRDFKIVGRVEDEELDALLKEIFGE